MDGVHSCEIVHEDSKYINISHLYRILGMCLDTFNQNFEGLFHNSTKIYIKIQKNVISLQNLKKWFDNNKLSKNLSKTKYMILANKVNFNLHFSVILTSKT